MGEEADERVRYSQGFRWVESPIVQEYLNRNCTGDPALNWIAHSVARYLHGNVAPRVLSLSCGGGVFERDLLGLVPQARVTGTDFSAGAIELAKQRAVEAGLAIEYEVVDLNLVELEPHAFDVVFASGALHHIDALERLLLQIRRGLSPEGFLIASEYVGPNCEIKGALCGPVVNCGHDQARPYRSGPFRRYHSASPQIFRLVELKSFGGTILHMMLQDIVGNFRPGDEVDDCILRMICRLEWGFIESGVLTSDFAYFVASPKPV